MTKIGEAIPKLQNIDSVSTVTGAEIGRSGKIVDRLMNFVDRIGGKVNRPGFGDVLLTKSKIKSSMIGHGVGNAKIETFAAVPDVIRDGIEIDHQSNWKGRSYDTYVFAAPIDYKGEKTYLGVIVQKDANNNRYYLHEVVDADGNVLYTNEAAPISASDGTSALTGDRDTVTDIETANNIIPNSGENVNRENAEAQAAAHLTRDGYWRDTDFTADENGNVLPKGAKISQFWANTLRTAEKNANTPKKLRTGPLWYRPISETESLERAARRLETDAQGTIEALIEAEAWSGVQVDAAAVVAERLYAAYMADKTEDNFYAIFRLQQCI